MKQSIDTNHLDRKSKVLQYIEERQTATVKDLCARFSISLATARRDLDSLAKKGKIQRVHGGAVALHSSPPEPPVVQRSMEHLEEKRRIARLAAQQVQDGETIFLGSGTTVAEVARELAARQNLTVITNSLPVINSLAGAASITVVCLGGILRMSELSMIGHLTEQSLAELHADKVILGVRGIDLHHGLTNDYLPETMTDRAILGAGEEVIVVADHSKCQRISQAHLADLSAIHTFVTDDAAPASFLEGLSAQGIRVLVG